MLNSSLTKKCPSHLRTRAHIRNVRSVLCLSTDRILSWTIMLCIMRVSGFVLVSYWVVRGYGGGVMFKVWLVVVDI